VADGVGGGAHGEIASSVLLAHCAEAPREIYTDPAKLVEWVSRADAEVRAAISRRTDRPGAATLAAAWFPARGEALVVNVGDCRAYKLWPQLTHCAVDQITLDQTYAALGQPPPENGSADDPARMVGAGAVGIPPVVRVRIRRRELLLLCSDGVHKFVTDREISDIVGAGLAEGQPLGAICAALVAAAKKNGGHDDASALLVQRRPWSGVHLLLACAILGALLAAFALMHVESADGVAIWTHPASAWSSVVQWWQQWTAP
jgi:protein phosphatase